MRLRISTLATLALIAVATPAGRLYCQAHDVTVRAGAGPARGYGGHHYDRDLRSVTLGLDFATRHERSGPVWGFGFTAYRGPGTIYPVRCAPMDSFGDCQVQSPFPEINLAYADLGWRAMAHDFNADFFLQPAMVLLSRPDVLIVGSSASVSVSRRLVRALAIEVGGSATYLPSFHPDRIGLGQLTVGLRSW